MNLTLDGRVHCLGSVYAEAVFSLYKRTLRNEPYNYDENTALEIVTRLTFIAAGNIKTWYSGKPPFGGCGSASGYREYLAADGNGYICSLLLLYYNVMLFTNNSPLLFSPPDDNGNLNDGTPHMSAIFKAFNDQEIACGVCLCVCVCNLFNFWPLTNPYTSFSNQQQN